MRVYDLAVASVVLTPRSAVRQLSGEMTDPTVYRAIGELEKLGFFTELTGRHRSRIYAYREYLAILNQGMTTDER